jgi:hypothetical protein
VTLAGPSILVFLLSFYPPFFQKETRFALMFVAKHAQGDVVRCFFIFYHWGKGIT